jgi:hypothetical protein
MKSAESLTKVEMIERSMSCFTLGLFALLPVIGIPMAMMSLVQSRRVKLGQGGMWNPGGRYRLWGSVFARIGIVLTFIVIVFIGIISYRPWQP